MSYYLNDPKKPILNSSIITIIFNHINNVLDVILYQNNDYKYQTSKSSIDESDKHITDLYFPEYNFLLKIYITKTKPSDKNYKNISIDIFNDKIRLKHKMSGILSEHKIYQKLKDIEYNIKLKKYVSKL
jgi:hypothetical protein